VPLVIAAIIVVLWMMGWFTDDNSRTVATVAVVGCVAAAFLIFGAALSQKAEEAILRKIENLTPP
jgi:hypothetical protein